MVIDMSNFINNSPFSISSKSALALYPYMIVIIALNTTCSVHSRRIILNCSTFSSSCEFLSLSLNIYGRIMYIGTFLML